MMKQLHTKWLLAIGLMLAASLPAIASVNLRLVQDTAHELGIAAQDDPEVLMLVTGGNDPYVYTAGISRALEAGETILSFEYMSTLPIDHFEVFFGYPAQAGVSYKDTNGIPQSAGWTTYNLDLTEAIAQFGWGKAGNRLRLDFGSVNGVGMFVRHFHIHKATDDPWVAEEEEQVTVEKVLVAGLPVLEVTTIDGEEPTYDIATPPDGSIGAGITNATKVPGQVRILLPDGTVSFDSGEYVSGTSGMTIKVRGNTSAYTSKKPYKIKLQKKADMLCRDDKKYNDKNWVLLKDESQLMRNGFKINELMGLQWAPQWQYVNVLFNGAYRGLYLLAEGVERNTDCRLNVSKTGFIVERDPYWWNEDGCYVASTLSPIYNYTFKYPDFADMDDATKAYVESTMLTFENSVALGTYDQYIDCESFALWLLGHDILGTYDSGGSNMYFTKYDNTATSLIKMGNMWDFDSTERCANAWSNLHVNTFPDYFYPKNPNPAFNQAYLAAWEQKKSTVFDDMIAYLTEYAASDEGAAWTTSNHYDSLLWGTENPSNEDATDRAIAWYKSRRTWLEQNIANIPSSVAEIKADAPFGVAVVGRELTVSGLDDSAEVAVIDMQGHEVYRGHAHTLQLQQPGIYVVTANGSARKVLIR